MKSLLNDVTPAYAVFNKVGGLIGVIVPQDENCLIMTKNTVNEPINGHSYRVLPHSDYPNSDGSPACDGDIYQVIVGKIQLGEL